MESCSVLWVVGGFIKSKFVALGRAQLWAVYCECCSMYKILDNLIDHLVISVSILSSSSQINLFGETFNSSAIRWMTLSVTLIEESFLVANFQFYCLGFMHGLLGDYLQVIMLV